MRLPPLHGLVVFEALVRRGKIVPAAEELCVTPGAISKQIGKLEEWFGRPLFNRVGRRLELTPGAVELLSEVRHALGRIERASHSFKVQSASHQLRVSAPPTFLTRWLIPRLGEFQQAFPGVRIQLGSPRDRSNSLPPNTDIAISRTAKEWQGFACTQFMREAITPVCSAEIAKTRTRWTVYDLQEYACLRASLRPHDWDDWCRFNAVSAADWHSVIDFDHTFLALDAALDSLGFVMGPIGLIMNDLISGTLHAPLLDHTMPAGGHFILHKTDDSCPESTAFKNWLLLEGQRHDQKVQEFLKALPPI